MNHARFDVVKLRARFVRVTVKDLGTYSFLGVGIYEYVGTYLCREI